MIFCDCAFLSSERSKVRVSFYQGARPQCLSPPPTAEQDSYILYPPLLSTVSDDMADNAVYNRQISTESGWDNPFRPDGDLSREADEIVSLIKGGKPITPTPPVAAPQLPTDEHKEEKAEANNVNASLPASPQTKVASPVLQTTPKAMNGTKNGAAVVEARAGPVEVQRSPPQEPQQPEHVTIRKKPKCKCCAIQ